MIGPKSLNGISFSISAENKGQFHIRVMHFISCLYSTVNGCTAHPLTSCCGPGFSNRQLGKSPAIFFREDFRLKTLIYLRLLLFDHKNYEFMNPGWSNLDYIVYCSLLFTWLILYLIKNWNLLDEFWV